MKKRTGHRRWNPDINCVEKQCIRCKEWWPEDLKFYHITTQGYYYSECIGCYRLRQRKKYRRRQPIIKKYRAESSMDELELSNT